MINNDEYFASCHLLQRRMHQTRLEIFSGPKRRKRRRTKPSVQITRLQRHTERLPQTQAIVKSFPCGRLESDGSFNFNIARRRFDVLGVSGYGYWSHRGGLVPHQDLGMAPDIVSTPYATRCSKIFESFDYLDGKDLLRRRHLSDDEGWKPPSSYRIETSCRLLLNQSHSLTMREVLSIVKAGTVGENSRKNLQLPFSCTSH
ncbi:putative MYND finger [Lyophyllum shimeji]|uniref:MYND finger n=1 Tax=Lyophyllum shimeji TaxID=47721 RepID=A0A9P3PH42_LYOSH|nr:putative MYND finger [Lyophyllum shimeji]